MAAHTHEKAVFHLPDLLSVAKSPPYVVVDHEFRGCDFHGPALFVLFGNVEFSGNTLNGAADALIWELPSDQGHVVGAFGFRDCAFLGCTFTHVGFSGPPDVVAEFRRVAGLS